MLEIKVYWLTTVGKGPMRDVPERWWDVHHFEGLTVSKSLRVNFPQRVRKPNVFQTPTMREGTFIK